MPDAWVMRFLYGYLLAWRLVMMTTDSLYAMPLDNGRTIIITGALLSEINRLPCWHRIIFSISVFSSKIHKRWLISTLYIEWIFKQMAKSKYTRLIWYNKESLWYYTSYYDSLTRTRRTSWRYRRMLYSQSVMIAQWEITRVSLRSILSVAESERFAQVDKELYGGQAYGIVPQHTIAGAVYSLG